MPVGEVSRKNHFQECSAGQSDACLAKKFGGDGDLGVAFLHNRRRNWNTAYECLKWG
jgi:hypothetical protein